MKTYQVRLTRKEGGWESIEAEDPEMAAACFGDMCFLDDNDRVTVRGVGIFKIVIEPFYLAQKV